MGLCPRPPSREESGVSRCAAEPGLATESPSNDAKAGVLSSTDEDFWPANFSVSRGSGVLLIPNLSLMRGFVSSIGSSGTTLFASARRRLKWAYNYISLRSSLTFRRTTYLKDIGEVDNLAVLFIELPSVSPHVFHFICEHLPSWKCRFVAVWLSSFNASDLFQYAAQRDWMLYDLVVFFVQVLIRLVKKGASYFPSSVES